MFTLQTYINLNEPPILLTQVAHFEQTPLLYLAQMKFTLAYALLSLFAAVAVHAQSDSPVPGHIQGVNTLNCRECPRTNCQIQKKYNRGDVSTFRHT
jgi:hypothetical protein